ncbi:MAG TPA: GNAT family N-acetyltransferase [Bacillus bacterium]|nr:GNAT family N-acetyltransferase [Bacillus sp. (in: firmicutes)]
MIIRKANEYEVNQLLKWSVSLTDELSVGYMKSNKHLTYDMVKNVLSNGGYYLVSLNGGKIIGWILLGIDRNFYKDETIGFLYELYVFPPYRKNGIGKLLMGRAISNFRNAGITKVQLNVFAGNSAKTMYEKLGFKEVTTLMEKEI